jgi:predicted small metal-binding protein
LANRKGNQKVTGADMANRKSIDCRDYPSEKNCSLKISGTEEEVLNAAAQHAVSAHGHEETPELREQIKSMLKDEAD